MASTKVNVYNLLKEKIQFLEMAPGSRIVERELAEEFGVSRTPIREALKRLEEDQLVEIYPQKGTYVSRIDFGMVKEMAYMRHILENDVLLSLCREKTQVAGAVDEKLLMMKLALRHRDYKAYIKQDAQFHRALFACGGHEVMWDTISDSLAHYTRVLVLDMMMPDNLAASYDSHVKISEYIESGDEESLRRTLAVHHDYEPTQTDDQIKRKHPDYFVH